MTDSHDTVTLQQAVQLLSVSRSTIYRLIKAGHLQTIQKPGCKQGQGVTRASIERYLRGSQQMHEAMDRLLQCLLSNEAIRLDPLHRALTISWEGRQRAIPLPHDKVGYEAAVKAMTSVVPVNQATARKWLMKVLQFVTAYGHLQRCITGEENANCQ